MPSYPTRNSRRSRRDVPAKWPVRRDIRPPKPANDNPVRLPKPANDNPRKPAVPGNRLPKSPLRFLPGLGVAFAGAAALDSYLRKRLPFDPPPMPNNGRAWYLRHGPNSYPFTQYAKDPTRLSRTIYRSNQFGPETGKILNQAVGAAAPTLQGPVADTWNNFGWWIPNDAGTRFAQFAAWDSFPIWQLPDWPGAIPASNAVPHWEPVFDPTRYPRRYPMPSPHTIPPVQFIPFPRAVPSPNWGPPPMPEPLAPEQVEPKWKPKPKAPLDWWPGANPIFGSRPSQRPAPTLSQKGPGAAPRYNPNGTHTLRKSTNNEKEKKGRDKRRAFRLGNLAGQLTELVDIHDAAYESIDIPPHLKTYYYGQDVTPAKRRMELVWRYAEHIKIDEFVKQLLVQHVQDTVIGKTMSQAEKALGKNRLRGVSRISRLGNFGR